MLMMFEKISVYIKAKLKEFSIYFLVFVTFALLFSLIRNVLKIKRVNEEISKKEQKVDELIRKNEGLRAEVDTLKSEEHVERQLRDKLGLAKEGEVVIVLPEESILRKLLPNIEAEEETLPDSNWKKWLKLFF